ncbi:MAG: MBL fold metallo-hydrolase, partial [Spirochaetaceae bacterium]|nr:MBL fold metallo-hydrolase [Spirochaetaceae bacterium]
MGNRTNSSVRAIVNVFFLLLVALLGWGCASAPTESWLETTVFEYERADDELLIWFFYLEDDDRSGDAILVMLPNGETMLIDAGIEVAGSQLKAHLDRLGVTHLDYAVATHAHNDHIGGFLPLFGSVTMDNYVTVNVPHSTDTYARVTRTVGDLQIPVTHVEAGERFSLPGGVEILVLNPPAG